VDRRGRPKLRPATGYLAAFPMARHLFLSLAFIAATAVSAQKPGKPPAAPSPDDDVVKARMKNDIQFLASDGLEGRETGLEGERLAGDYLVGRFEELGLPPLGDTGTYRQAFTFAIEPERGPKNSLQLGHNPLTLGVDFYPVSYSPTAGIFTRLARCK